MDEDKITKILKFYSLQNLNLSLNTYNFNGNDIHIFKIILNNDDKPVLFALAGISNNSFNGTSAVILNKLELLGTKFKEIYLVEYSSFGQKQIDACGLRDKLKHDHIGLGDDKLNNIIYKPELDMNNEIANNLNEIILMLNLNNVHLLGKCNGAWIVTLLLMKQYIYKGLYLSVLGIPFNVNMLHELPQNRLVDINFVFSWIKQDGFPFHWNSKSFQEKDKYDKTIREIAKNNNINMKYSSVMYDNQQSEDKKQYHEIYPDMIDLIISEI